MLIILNSPKKEWYAQVWAFGDIPPVLLSWIHEKWMLLFEHFVKLIPAKPREGWSPDHLDFVVNDYRRDRGNVVTFHFILVHFLIYVEHFQPALFAFPNFDDSHSVPTKFTIARKDQDIVRHKRGYIMNQLDIDKNLELSPLRILESWDSSRSVLRYLTRA